ncbi:MAG: site-specific integrase [Castellaniella sp.]|uniref:tyrosine-type recombinase/integrase n=1 Tax=Castellaniella sp. TaxID=1955812 RepID=UPI003C72C84B
MSRITAIALDRLTPADDKRILREDGGIVGRVRAGKKGITVWFRYDTKLDGKKHDYSLGTWPGKSLAEIRAERDRIRTIVADGIDPNDAKKADRIKRQQAVAETIRKADEERIKAMTVQDLFDVWVSDGVARQDGNAELKRLFGKDVLPVIGEKPLRELTDKDILTMLRRMLKRGVTRQAVIAYNDVNQMLAWGEKRQPWRGLLMNGNPCDLVDVGKLLPADYEEERDRILSPAEIRELSDIYKRMDADYTAAPNKRSATRPVDPRTRIALWLCLGTICRIGELLMARWEHVNLDDGVWFIPRENVKGHRGKKQEHFVFLNDFSKRQFQALKEITGESAWCFPAKNRKGEETHVCLKSVSKQCGDRQVRFKNRSKPLKGRAFDDSLVLADGANGEWTPHDLRRTGASTMQALGVSLDVIDRCQNHLLAGKVRRVYLRHDYEAEKTEAWHKLGDRLDAILAGGAEIVYLRSGVQ